MFPSPQVPKPESRRNVKLAITVVRGLNLKRASLLEKQQHLARAGLHGAAALPEIGDDTEPEDSLVKSRRTGYVVNVERTLQDPFRFRNDANPSFRPFDDKPESPRRRNPNPSKQIALNP